MGTVIEQLQEAFVIVIGLQAVAALFLDRAQLKSRQRSLLASVGVEPIISPGRATLSCFYLFMFGWYSIRIVYDLSGHPAYRASEALALFWKIAVAAVFAGTVLIIAGVLRSAARMRDFEEYRLFRGQLFENINKLSRKVRLSKLFANPVYVPPDDDFAKLCARIGTGVVLPRGLLDELSRREVDVLVARQLCMQSGKFYLPAFWIFLACNAAVVALIQNFQFSPLAAILTYSSLLAAELFAFGPIRAENSSQCRYLCHSSNW